MLTHTYPPLTRPAVVVCTARALSRCGAPRDGHAAAASVSSKSATALWRRMCGECPVSPCAVAWRQACGGRGQPHINPPPHGLHNTLPCVKITRLSKSAPSCSCSSPPSPPPVDRHVAPWARHRKFLIHKTISPNP
eukprot:scaffold133_cov407-Prasinococcus_capsulatus_cf.AAC.2